MKILTFEEWKDLYADKSLTQEAKEDLERYHQIDLVKEIDLALKGLYDDYVESLTK